jgi:predicted N-formylglutamate amidohydrolase
MFRLAAADPDPVIAHNVGSSSPFLIVCDHAGRRTPEALGDLGLPPAEWERHIAFDIGAAGLASALADRLGGACLIEQVYSRLVIDCNRAPGRSDAIVEVADGAEVPGNLALSPADRQARVEAIHAPYHAAIAAELDARAARGLRTALILIHSFTPAMGGIARPWHVGVLHKGSALSLAALAWLRGRPELVIGDNQPYAMDEVDYTAPVHGQARGLDYLELETRQDLIADAVGQARFADLYAAMLTELVA